MPGRGAAETQRLLQSTPRCVTLTAKPLIATAGLWTGGTRKIFAALLPSENVIWKLLGAFPRRSLSSESLLSRRAMVDHMCRMCWFTLGILLPSLVVAAPPPINKLALFPDKSAWCEAKNITQIVGHTGCESKSIKNRACLGQCFSYSVPNTFPQSTESLVHCDSCMPAQSMWEIVKLECPGNEEMPRVDKLVEKILHCSCQACGKEQHQDSQLFNGILNEEEASPGMAETHQIIHHEKEIALKSARDEA